MNTSEILNGAGDAIQKFGWRGDDGGDLTGHRGMCLLNAIAYSAGVLAPEPAIDAMRRHLGVSYPHEWNDTPGRTAAEVIEVLRACAVIEQAREEQDAAWATYAGLVTA